MDSHRHHSKGGIPLTPAAGAPSPAPPKRRLWVLLLIAAVLGSRLFSHRAFAADDTYTVQIGQSTIDVTVQGELEGMTPAELKDFITSSARGVAAYFGRFPLPHARLMVHVNGGRGIDDGHASPGPVPTIHIGLGSQTTRASLQDDWVLVHEMTHLGFPDVDGPHKWMSEGFATYIEPIERVRNGSLNIQKFWADLVKDLPKGIPDADDNGFDQTHSWASTYWGGALFWFLTDVQIRAVTANKKGLEDVMRAINHEGGDMHESWSLEMFLRVSDGEIGSPVMSRMYDQWARRRGTVNLDAIWKRLGIASAGYPRVTFDDSAPLAGARRAITGKPKAA